MRNSVFTVLAIATMVVSMSSCSQNDGGSSNDLNLQQNVNVSEKAGSTNVNDSSSTATVESRSYGTWSSDKPKPVV